ncbi:TPA: tail fiber protein [Serratia marcescens]|nr:tail fiber protein [Serratia marcescens]
MTDKTPQDKAENPVNTPTTFAGTTNTAREGEPKSRALPQVDELKARFQAGSIPLQTDFADLIDMANIGRQAVGDEARGFGLTKDNKNRLYFDPSKIAYLNYDLSPSKKNEQITLNDIYSGVIKNHKKVALLALNDQIGPISATKTQVGNSTTYTVGAVKIDSNGVRSYQSVNIIADKSIGKGSGLLPFEYVQNTSADYSFWYRFTLDTSVEDFSNCTLVIDPLTLFVKHITDFSTLPLDGEIISLLNVSFIYHGVIIGDGLQKDNTKISAKVDVSKGLQVNSSGIGVYSGNGIAVNSSGVNVKLAKGSHTNSDEGQGENGTTDGNAGGLVLSSTGLSVDAGDGIQINTRGVSIKLATNSGLSADETNGLRVVPEQQFQRGMIIMFSGTSAPSGWVLCDGNNGTPDLRNKFIKAASGFSTSAGGSNTVGFTPKGTVSVDNHTLTINEMPNHSHEILKRFDDIYGSGLYYPSMGLTSKDSTASDFIASNLSYSGGGKGHNHTASFKGETSSIKIEPEFFSLAFIMKL